MIHRDRCGRGERAEPDPELADSRPHTSVAQGLHLDGPLMTVGRFQPVRLARMAAQLRKPPGQVPEETEQCIHGDGLGEGPALPVLAVEVAPVHDSTQDVAYRNAQLPPDLAQGRPYGFLTMHMLVRVEMGRVAP